MLSIGMERELFSNELKTNRIFIEMEILDSKEFQDLNKACKALEVSLNNSKEAHVTVVKCGFKEIMILIENHFIQIE